MIKGLKCTRLVCPYCGLRYRRQLPKVHPGEEESSLVMDCRRCGGVYDVSVMDGVFSLPSEATP